MKEDRGTVCGKERVGGGGIERHPTECRTTKRMCVRT